MAGKDMMEYDENGNPKKGGGYMKKGGKLYKMQKSETAGEGDPELSGDDLEKSLNQLEQYVQDGDTASRKDELLAKAQSGELEKSERDELFQILGGATPEGDPTGESTGDNLVKSLTGNESIQQALDVSDFLREQQEELVKSLKGVGDYLEKSDNRQHEFNLVLAKAVGDIGTLVKSMSEQFENMLGQPAHAPRSRGVQTQPGQVLNKGFGGQPSGEEQLTKSEVADALDGLMQESLQKGRSGATAAGEDILGAITKYEASSMISPTMLQEVRNYRAKQTATH